MARTASVAIGGFYPTPTHLLPRIASLLALATPPKAKNQWESSRHGVFFMDPCAGEGEAILRLRELLLPEGSNLETTLYGCELEATRAEALKKAATGVNYVMGKECLSGDAFRITFGKTGQHGERSGVSLLYLNPPYDTDRVHGRLEQRFLDRFTSALAIDGVLVFVVPSSSLKASATLLGLEYQDVRCFRFPLADYEAYKQVVLYARKTEKSLSPDQKIVSQVEAWAADPSTIPEFPGDPEALYTVPVYESYRGGLYEWRTRPVDITSLLGKLRPWFQTTKGGALLPVTGVIPEMPVEETLLRTYPLATPPRPAHIAAGIASGLFNGARIEPSDPKTQLPPLLVKGVFDREYKTIEEKKNKLGEVRAVVQVQQPKLVTTVLNLKTHTYCTLTAGTEETGSLDVSKMNAADLLKHYGNSLMGVMEKQCPVLYDPRRDGPSIPLRSSPRKLFTAQSHAAKALVKLLGGANVTMKKRKGKAAILLGEIGSGKSTVSLMAGHTIGAKRFLIMCPPHLLKSWQNEIATVLPKASVRVLSTVEDLQEAESVPCDPDQPLICILSREAGKLTHSWEGAGPICPKCGGSTPDIDLAKKRARCEHQHLLINDGLAREAYNLALALLPHAPDAHVISTLLRGRFDRLRIDRLRKNEERGPFPGLNPALFDGALGMLLTRFAEQEYSEGVQKAITAVLLAAWNEKRIAQVVRMLVSSSSHYHKSLGRNLLLFLPPGHPEQAAIQEEYPAPNTYSYSGESWGSFRDAVREFEFGREIRYPLEMSWATGKLVVSHKTANSVGAIGDAIAVIGNLGRFGLSASCGEELFGAVPEPRRVSLARHISRYHRDTFDFLILDEGHEYGNDGTAQERAGHRLTTLQIPTVLMTGTIMNGYAESMFSNMWALSPAFRLEFAREDRQRFIDRYGYRKRLLEDKDSEGEVVEFGSQSDRVTRSERIVGNAPGVLPLFLLKHLLPISVTLHKKDLAIDLPPCRQIREVIEPSPHVKSASDKLQRTLAAAIRKDQFVPDRAGRLFGQLAELPSYLDRATIDVGNVDSGDYEIRYPESVGGELVAVQPGLPSHDVLTKEQWMLDTIKSELDQGRCVMVFSWHVDLLPRLSRLIEEHTREKAPILHADKVATGKRQDWIDREIVKKNRKILVTNPVVIQTGLNNLVHFATEIWMENPACNPTIFRQATGRVDRIGQKLETRVYFPIYGDTLQVQLYDLLMRKVAVSISTDGLDPESALQAAGLGEDEYLAGLSIGKQLWAMIGGLDTEDGDVVPVRTKRAGGMR